MGMNADNKGDRAKIKALLKKWLSLGSLKIEIRKDARYKDKTFVVAGQRVDDLEELAAKAKTATSAS
jgi:hypothetical protein